MFASVIGICDDLAAGTHSISLSSYTTNYAQFHVGYATAGSRLYVEELGQRKFTKGNTYNIA